MFGKSFTLSISSRHADNSQYRRIVLNLAKANRPILSCKFCNNLIPRDLSLHPSKDKESWPWERGWFCKLYNTTAHTDNRNTTFFFFFFFFTTYYTGTPRSSPNASQNWLRKQTNKQTTHRNNDAKNNRASW